MRLDYSTLFIDMRTVNTRDIVWRCYLPNLGDVGHKLGKHSGLSVWSGESGTDKAGKEGLSKLWD